MRAKLYYKNIQDHAIPYLWNDEMGVNHAESESFHVRSKTDHDIARDAGAWNRSRSITIVEGRQAAMSLAMIADDTVSGRSIITHLGDDAWSVGTIHLNGEYDSGIPTITDARVFGHVIELDMDEELLRETSYTQLALHAKDVFEEISPRPDASAEPN